MLVDCVDLVAGVWTIRSVFTYAYILMLMSMVVVMWSMNLSMGDLTVSHSCNVSMVIAYIVMHCARYSCRWGLAWVVLLIVIK